jgi:hypothetical protein
VSQAAVAFDVLALATLLRADISVISERPRSPKPT